MGNNDLVKKGKFYELSQNTGFTEKQIETLKCTSLSTLKTESQVVLALSVAKKYDLDIFAKEFWAWVDNRGTLITIASAEGFKKIARKQSGFISIQANAVFEGEEFSMNTGTGEVNHVISTKCRGGNKKPIGAYARLKMNGKEDEVKWVDWSEYSNDHVTFSSPWKKQRSAMIEKCAITVLCRQVFGLSGLYGEEEMDYKINKKHEVKTGGKEAIKEVQKAINNLNSNQNKEDGK